MAALASARASLGRRYVFCLALSTLAGGCNSVFGIHDGTPPPPCYDPGPTPLLIDDMEDGVGDICNLGNRQGYWYTVGDGTEGTLSPAQSATFTPTMIPGGRGSSHYAARFTGSGFTGWGALMGFNLDAVGLMRQTVNASSTGGITFWMKNDAPVSVQFLIPDTVLQKQGGDCVPNASNPNCSSDFSFEITAPNADWVQYQVPFAALTQQYGGTATWNPQLLLGVQFAVGPGAAFDVWVDDISFYYDSTGLPTCTDPAFTVPCPAGGSYPAGCWSAGTDCSAVATWCSNPLLIDDMEDGNAAICNSGGRQGSWWTSGDGPEGTLSPAQGATFTMTPIPGGRGESLRAAHMMGSGFTEGAGMGFSIGGLGAMPAPYDASASGGVTFWMKTDAPWVELQFPTSETVPISDGGLCADGATTFNCQNYFVFEIPGPSNAWVQYHVPFSALYQGFYETDADDNVIVGSATWDPTSLENVLFNVYSSASFELWIDDVSFYNCTNETCVPTCSDPTAVACPALEGVVAGCWPAGTDCSNLSSLIGATALLAQVWGGGPDDVWAVGSAVRGAPTMLSPTILHWDGSVWSSVESGATPPLWGVWGSNAADVWAVGDFGTIIHWNGIAWSASSSGVSGSSLQSVWGSSADDVWAVGADGAIVHWDGATWSVSTSVSTKALYHLWGSAPDDVWAVGDAGTIVHWDGTAWSASASGTTSALWGVWGSSSSDVYAVGDTTTGEATVLHWNGAAWSTVSTPADGYPNSVWGSGPDDVWIVGFSILHFDGATWSTVPKPVSSSPYLSGVWGSGPSDVWIAGDESTLLHWNGSTWSVVPAAGIQQ